MAVQTHGLVRLQHALVARLAGETALARAVGVGGAQALQILQQLARFAVGEGVAAHVEHRIAQARGQSLAQMALAWVLRDKRVTTALIGASKVSQLEDNFAAIGTLDFGSDELAAIDAILA